MAYGAGLATSGFGAGRGGFGAGMGGGAFGAGYGPATASFSPSSLASIVLWFDFSDVSTLWQDAAGTTPVASDGDPIARADSKVGGLTIVFDGTAGHRPLWKANIQNGRGVARFDGTDDQLAQSGGSAWSQPNHIFATFAWNATASGNQKVYDGVTNRNTLYANSVEGGVQPMIIQSGTVRASDAFFPDLAVWHQFSALYNGAASVLRRDAVADSAGDAGADSLRNLIVGCDTGGAVQFFKGDIGELIVCNAALTGTDLTNVETTWLKSRWGTP